MKKTKKQHYVPRCYLEKFQIQDTYQVHTYDKQQRKARINSIYDIASENYFYDTKISDIPPEDINDDINKKSPSENEINEEQYIEHYLSNNIEAKYSNLLEALIQKANNITPWIVHNCYFLSATQKLDFSIFLAIQYVRTKSVRLGIAESSDCFLQVLDDMNASQNIKESMTVTKEDLKYIHGKMILDNKHLIEAALLFNRLKWVFGINTTSKLFYTSDSPIGTRAHLSDPIVSMSGLSSKGIEVFLPITPRSILIMIDGNYHKNTIKQDREYFIITDTDIVDYYNSLSVVQSSRCVFSADGDFTLIDQMIKKDPQALTHCRTELRWGGKIYRPRKV